MSDTNILASNLDYCESVRNIDDMLIQFNQDRQIVVNLLKHDPDKLVNTLWTPYSPVCRDDHCLFNMGKTIIHYSLEERINGSSIINEGVINYYMCPQCNNMSRLVDFGYNGIIQPFMIECGRHSGEQLEIKEVKINNLFMVKEKMPEPVRKILDSPDMLSLQKCNSQGCVGGNYESYLGSDPYTNNLFINWYIQDELEKINIPHIQHMHIGFVCSDLGFNLYEHPDIGRFRHLQEHPNYLTHQGTPTAKIDDTEPLANNVIGGIVLSLFSTFHALSKYDFSHGNPSSKNLLFKDESCSYIYDGVHISCPITLKLVDFYNSGVTVNNKLRLYCKSVLADDNLLKKPLVPIIETMTYTPYVYRPRIVEEIKESNPVKTTIYRLKDPDNSFKETILFMYIKHLGLPIYQSSFDIYSFMIILMSEKAFYNALMNNDKLYKLWRNMWLPSEFEIIQDRILDLHEQEDPMKRSDNVIRVLAGLGLRCDMIDYGWTILKSY